MGGLDSGESTKEAADRELLEETGIRAELKKIGEFYPVPGLSPQNVSVFYGTISEREAKNISRFNENNYVDEITDRKILSMDNIIKMIETQEISDGFTLSSLAIWKLGD